MRDMKFFVELSLLSVLLVGCGKQDSGVTPSSAVSQKQGDDAPIVTLGSHVLTRGAMMRRVAMMGALQKYRFPKVTAEQAGKYRERLTKGCPYAFVQEKVLEDYAAKEKVSVSKELIAEFEASAFKKFRTKKDKSYADVRRHLGEYGSELDAQVRAEALRQAIRFHFLELWPTNIPDSYVDDQMKRFKSYNQSAVLTNALVYARATNVWEQLKKGAKFEDMASKYSEIDDERESKGTWGTLDRRQLGDDPEILKWGQKLKVGEFSPPIEADNGLMIMRLDSRDDGATEFGVSRIFFQLPEFLNPAPPEEIKKAAYDKYARELFARKVAELEAAAKPVYAKSETKEQLKKNKKKGK